MNCIEQLKQYVVQSKDLNEPFNYFFNLKDADAFSKIKNYCVVKQINQHTELMAVVQIIQKETHEQLNRATKQLIPIFHEIPEHHFFHGVCLSCDLVMPLTVIYFADVKTGIFSATGKQIDMMRFSLMQQVAMKEKH